MNLNNQMMFDLGFGAMVDPRTLVSVFYKERTALADGLENPRDLSVKANYKVDERSHFLAHADAPSAAQDDDFHRFYRAWQRLLFRP